jgi:hypothetical protein
MEGNLKITASGSISGFSKVLPIRKFNLRSTPSLHISSLRQIADYHLKSSPPCYGEQLLLYHLFFLVRSMGVYAGNHC